MLSRRPWVGLGPGSTLEALATAFATAMISALVAGGRELAIMRIVARGRRILPEVRSGSRSGSIGFAPTC